MASTPSTAICTIVAKNYLAYARTLAASFTAQHPAGRVFVLVIDQPDGCYDPQLEPFTVVQLQDLAIEHAEQMAFRYDVLELSTAVKPFLLEYLFEQYQLETLIYLDPDIACYRPLTPLLDPLLTRFMVLTPHMLAPSRDDGHAPGEIHILQAGAYNLGCIGLARRPQLLPFLRWWQEHLRRDCVVDIGRALFVDQRWMDLAPALFEGVAIVRDPGCNVAYWNLNTRRISSEQGHYLVDGSPLTFFHFSGIRLDAIDRISVHQDRYTLDDLPQLRPLFLQYREWLLANGMAVAQRWRYSYRVFDNGVAIPAVARALWRDQDGEQRWPLPFHSAGRQSFYTWLTEDAHPAADAGPLTNLAVAIYQQRADVRAAFPDVVGTHRRGFLNWFIEDAAWQHQLDPAFIRPIRDRLEQLDRLAAPAVSAAAPAPIAPTLALPPPALPRNLAIKRKIYYAIRNPLRRIGWHQQIRRMLGRRMLIRVYDSLVLESDRLLTDTQSTAIVDPAHRPIVTPIRGLNIIGYFGHPTGVGEVARSVLQAMRDSDYPVCAIDVERHLPLDPPTMEYAYNLVCANADALPGVRQVLGTGFWHDRRTIGFWHWETASFPPEWHDRFGMLDELWVASDYVRDTIAAVAPIPVCTMPIPLVPPAVRALPRARFGIPPERFIWLFAFDMRSVIERKNPHAAIAAFREAFGSSSTRAHLVIKANHLEEYPEAAAQLRAAVAAVGGTLIEQTMSREQINGLFAMCDGYLSLHRSEGFGLTMAEAMALGKPVVATAYSGNMQFMNEQNSFPVHYTLIEIDREYGPYARGDCWADPDIAHAAELLTLVVHDPIGAARGHQAAIDIRNQFAPAVVARQMIARLETIARLSPTHNRH